MVKLMKIYHKDIKLIICSQILNNESLVLKTDHYFGDIFNKIPIEREYKAITEKITA